jgi:hypothetical protein
MQAFCKRASLHVFTGYNHTLQCNQATVDYQLRFNANRKLTIPNRGL